MSCGRLVGRLILCLANLIVDSCVKADKASREQNGLGPNRYRKGCLDKGSLGIGIFTAISSGAYVIWCIYDIILLTQRSDPNRFNAITAYHNNEQINLEIYYNIITGVISLVTCIFSILLCYGVNKRRPRLILAFLVYAWILFVTALAFALFQVFGSPVRFIPMKLEAAIFIFIGCLLVYNPCLRIIYHTYRKIRDTIDDLDED